MLFARSRQPVLRALVLLGFGSVWAAACGGSPPLGAAGSVCFRADECQAGLACVPQTPGSEKRVCSADLSGIVSMVDGAAPEAGDAEDAMGGTSATPAAGSPATAGAPGAAGKPAAGGTGGASSGGAGETSSAGTTAGGGDVGGSASAGAPSAGSSASGADNGGASAGTGG